VLIALKSLRGLIVRTALLFLSILVVSTAFTLLLSASQTLKVTVDQDLAEYWRTTYDILVRPPGYRTPIEEKYGLVQANHLSGIPGGITFGQYEAIKHIPGVEVAAPVAMLSYFDLEVRFGVWLELGRRELINESGAYLERITLTASDNVRRYETIFQHYYYASAQPAEHSMEEAQDAYAQGLNVLELDGSSPYVLGATYQIPVLMAAVDPDQESKLVGLDSAVVQGNYFTSSDTVRKIQGRMIETDESIYGYVFPILINTHSYVQAEIQRDLWRVDLPGKDETLGEVLERGGIDYLDGLPSYPLSSFAITNEEVYRWLPSTWDNLSLQSLGVGDRLGFTSFTNPPSRIQYVEKQFPGTPSKMVLEAVPLGRAECPPLNSTCTPQVGFRSLSRRKIKDSPANIRGELKGVFDINKLSALTSELIYVPVETYYPPLATLRYDEHGNSIDPGVVVHPTLNPEGYIQCPPLILTTLETARLFNPVDPISAIRVRVGGIDRFSPEAQAKIEAIAGAIIEATGLDVDVVVGSSPQRVLVHIPGYDDIAPLGYVEELWIHKGVTLSYLREIRRVNLIFFSLILSVCALNILNTTHMTVLGRRWEIALLKALGWRSSTVFGLVLLELGAVGLVAGMLGALLAWILAALLELEMQLYQLLFVIPLAMGLCLFGGVLPAWAAARTSPASALRQGEISYHRPVFFGRLSLATYALRSLIRRRARTVLVTFIMALAAVLLSIFLAASLSFQGYLSGTLLGEYLALRIEGYHYLMAVVCLLVAGITTADVLLVSTLERRREIGLLKALGWSTTALARLFLIEGALLGTLGGLMGTGAGLGSMVYLYRALPLGAVWAGILGVGVPAAVGVLAALYPARVASIVPPAESMRHE
jgi:cell division protein FtsX